MPLPSSGECKNQRYRPFFLEWERRAVRPSTMAARLAPYLRYYSSHRPTDDHGVQPTVLVVLEDALTASHFLRTARDMISRQRLSLPLMVSDTASIQRHGPLGPAWRSLDRRGMESMLTTPDEWFCATVESTG